MNIQQICIFSISIFITEGYTLHPSNSLAFCSETSVKRMTGAIPGAITGVMTSAILCTTQEAQIQLQLEASPSPTGPWDFYFSVDEGVSSVSVDGFNIKTNPLTWQRVSLPTAPSNVTYMFKEASTFAIPQVYIKHPQNRHPSSLPSLLAAVFLTALFSTVVILLYRNGVS